MLVPGDVKELADSWPLWKQFDIAPGSLCVVAGAYKGKVMQLLADEYQPGMIMGYEPQLWAAAEARQRLAAYENCRVLGYALGTAYTALPMGEFFTDACSFINVGEGSREQGSGLMKDAAIVLATALRSFDWGMDGPRHEIDDIELFVMNMEGYEFELLPYLIQREIIQRIKKLAVQFHEGLGNDGSVESLCAAIDVTHTRVVDTYPEWIYWVRKDG